VPRIAGAPIQPIMVLACGAAIILLGLIGTRWADGPRRGESKVEIGSDISFGVYLAHPLILTLLLNNGFGWTRTSLNPALASGLAFVGTVVGAALLSWVARQTPLAMPLTGRPWKRRVKAPDGVTVSIGSPIGATAS
jgi:peptidoglycan/LPS O-acetylase OafA/YrhL